MDISTEDNLVKYLTSKLTADRIEFKYGLLDSYRKENKVIPRPEMEIKSIEERLAESMGVKIIQDLANDEPAGAFWNKPSNTIHTHPKNAYESLAKYRETILHELAHSTIIPLNRKPVTRGHEELLAESTAMIVGRYEGNLDADTIEHAVYISNTLAQDEEAKQTMFLMQYAGIGFTEAVELINIQYIKLCSSKILEAKNYLINKLKSVMGTYFVWQS